MSVACRPLFLQGSFLQVLWALSYLQAALAGPWRWFPSLSSSRRAALSKRRAAGAAPFSLLQQFQAPSPRAASGVCRGGSAPSPAPLSFNESRCLLRPVPEEASAAFPGDRGESLFLHSRSARQRDPAWGSLSPERFVCRLFPSPFSFSATRVSYEGRGRST